MTFIIRDATGEGNGAKVDVNNRVHALAVSIGVQTEAAIEGDAYNVNTGLITLTSDSPSALFYFKNNNGNPILIPRVFYNIGDSNGTGRLFLEVIKNPSTGTIVSGGTAFDPVNFDFGSAKSLTVDCLKGQEGDTFTNGEVFASTLVPSDNARVLIGLDTIVLSPGASFGIRVTPPSGNTSMELQVGVNAYEYEIVNI